MRFATVDPYFESTDWSFRGGRPVANESFLAALLSYGTWDEYQFFYPDVSQVERYTARLRSTVAEPARQERVKVRLQLELPLALREESFDVFHQSDFTASLPYLVEKRNRFAGQPFPITGVTHSLDGAAMHLRFLELALAGLAPFDGVVCTSEAAAETLRRKFAEVSEQLQRQLGARATIPAQTTVIPLGVDDSLFSEMDRAQARSFLSIPPDATVGLSVGRLSVRTKTDWAPVLELLARMRQSQELGDTIFIVAGGGSDENIALVETLIKQTGLEQTVLLFPNFPPQVKLQLYRAADFYFSSVDNFQETFGINVVEAMAAALPVVVSDFSGYRDAVTEGENGFLIPTVCIEELPPFIGETVGLLDSSLSAFYYAQTVALDLARLREALLALIRDPELRVRMGARSRQQAEGYHWSRIIPRYEAFWRDLRRQAAETPFERVTGPETLVGDPVGAFTHFATYCLSDQHAVETTPVGRAVRRQPGVLVRYQNVAPALDAEMERLVLGQAQDGPVRVGQLRKDAAARLGATQGETDFHIVWLLKHGALRLRGAAPRPDAPGA